MTRSEPDAVSGVVREGRVARVVNEEGERLITGSEPDAVSGVVREGRVARVVNEEW
ncbi:hypothetical protein SAMN05216275_14810 [Streptosporangium canum]|uniref:Uncharacterized protein n=1 Tax=Streptosporangium canum TaxID=324952 RepID=A0A1I4EDK7_9ACTN|nr:hypothetical protein SAMN05216275_14810 [Streptosporangium canum]